MLQTIGKSPAQPLPASSTVFAAVNFASGVGERAGLAPGCGIMFGGRDEHSIRIARTPNETIGINVGRPFGAGPSLPVRSAIESDVKPGAAGDEDFLRIARVDERPVNVVEMLHGTVLIAQEPDGVQLAPTFS